MEPKAKARQVSHYVETAAPGGHGGTQAIRRAIALLREVAATKGGASLSGLAVTTGLTTSTVHRTLSVLTAEGMLSKDPQTRRYRPGPLLQELSLAAAPRLNLCALARPVLERLADATGDTAYLNARSGADALCLDCCEGSFPIRALPMSIGNRRPLGVGAASIAVLGALPVEEASGLLAGNVRRLMRAGLTLGRVEEALEELRRIGHVVTTGRLGARYRGVAVPVPDPGGRFAMALSISAVAERLSVARQARVAAMLRSEAKLLSALLDGSGHGPA